MDDIALHLDREFGHVSKRCLRLCGRVVDSGKKSSNLFLSWHNPVHGSSACGILVQLGDLEGKSIWPPWGRVEEPLCQIFAD